MSCGKKIAHAHVCAHLQVCDVRAKQGLKRACDVRACEAFRGLASCDRKFATFCKICTACFITEWIGIHFLCIAHQIWQPIPNIHEFSYQSMINHTFKIRCWILCSSVFETLKSILAEIKLISFRSIGLLTSVQQYIVRAHMVL